MVYEIKHYCHEGDPEPTNYVIARRDTPPPPLAILMCQRCKERMVILDETALFAGAHVPGFHRTPGTLIVPGKRE
jgi:hypothetical protein